MQWGSGHHLSIYYQNGSLKTRWDQICCDWRRKQSLKNGQISLRAAEKKIVRKKSSPVHLYGGIVGQLSRKLLTVPFQAPSLQTTRPRLGGQHLQPTLHFPVHMYTQTHSVAPRGQLNPFWIQLLQNLKILYPCISWLYSHRHTENRCANTIISLW